jgi:hypothetical protein
VDASATKPIIAKIRLYRDRVEFYRRKAAESEHLAAENEKIVASWEAVLSQIQELQRQEQPAATASAMPLEELKAKAEVEAANRFDLARELLIRHREEGILPVDIRRLANARGFSSPSNFPYKLLTNLVKQGRARRDHQTGRYFPVVKEAKGKAN